MKIAILDADLIGRTKHRFPNLACMKISGYHKALGDSVTLKTDYGGLGSFDRVYISKVFTDTPFPEEILSLPNVEYGGTGFFFDKASDLSVNIEHSFPDYHLYDGWIEDMVSSGKAPRSQFKEYADYSIGFLTRGCFRKCKFCVNQKYDRVFLHSSLTEFMDPDRKKICMLDDNFFGCGKWKEMLLELQATGKPFKFKQGLDERLLTEEKCEMLFRSKYDGDFTFAFDNVADYDLIERKLQMIRRHTLSTRIKFYVLVGFESTDSSDIENAFKRVELLMRYGCLPYIMRYQNKNDAPWKRSKYRGMYITMARWCNQPSFFKKASFREFCELCARSGRHAEMKYLTEFESEHPEIAAKYFDKKWRPILNEDCHSEV